MGNIFPVLSGLASALFLILPAHSPGPLPQPHADNAPNDGHKPYRLGRRRGNAAVHKKGNGQGSKMLGISIAGPELKEKNPESLLGLGSWFGLIAYLK